MEKMGVFEFEFVALFFARAFSCATPTALESPTEPEVALILLWLPIGDSGYLAANLSYFLVVI